MQTLGYVVWLGKMALECAEGGWFITVPLVVFAVISTAFSFRGVDREKRRRMACLPILYSFPLMGLMIGGVFRAYQRTWPSYLLWFPLVGLVGLAVVWVIRFRRLRTAVVSHAMLAFWANICAGFVATMAITDKWL